MRGKLRLIGLGAKWSILMLEVAVLLNPYLVTGVAESDGDIVESESRSPYLYLSQREYLIQPDGGYEEVAHYPEEEDEGTGLNATSSPPGTLRQNFDKLKRYQESSSSEEVEGEPKENSRYSRSRDREAYRQGQEQGEEENLGEESNQSPASIQDVINHKQGQYGPPAGSGQGSYDSLAYQSPALSYEMPLTTYLPAEHYGEWPNSYGPPGGHHGGVGHGVTGFLAGIGEVTSQVKHLKTQVGEQKAKTAYQVADVVKSTGWALNNAILNKGHTAAKVVGQTVDTAGQVLASKGHTASKLIQGTGNLATSAFQSAGNVGSSLIRTKGELLGAALKTGSTIGKQALSTASNALEGGTYLIKAKGDAASNLISKGGWIASSVIGTKGRLLSSVITAKNNFAAQVIEAKGKAAATLLETSGQKLSQLADAIKSATAQKHPHGWSEPGAVYSAPPAGKGESGQEHQSQEAYQAPEQDQPAQLQQEELPLVQSYQYQAPQDYADSYYQPRDPGAGGHSNQYGNRIQRNLHKKKKKSQRVIIARPEEDNRDDEFFLNEYSAYYPHHYSIRPHTDYQAQYAQYQI